MNKNIETLIDEIKNQINERLLSVILYGSYADGTNTKSSDINLIVVIEQLTAVDLKNLNPVIKKWQKSNNSLPVFMGKAEWFASTDVYPMEYSDIKNRHSIFYGEDIISDIKIDKCHLRLQCESETKNLLIRLRQGYVLNCGDKKIISELIVNSIKSLIAIFKTVLNLISDDKISNDKYQVIKEISPLIGLDSDFFIKVVEFKDNKKILNLKESDLMIQKLIDSIYEVLKYVDKINTCKEV